MEPRPIVRGVVRHRRLRLVRLRVAQVSVAIAEVCVEHGPQRRVELDDPNHLEQERAVVPVQLCAGLQSLSELHHVSVARRVEPRPPVFDGDPSVAGVGLQVGVNLDAAEPAWDG